MPELAAMIDDFENGRPGQVTVGDDPIVVDPASETIELPLGPFIVTGSPSEWRAFIQREMDEVEYAAATPEMRADPWIGARRPILAAEVE